MWVYFYCTCLIPVLYLSYTCLIPGSREKERRRKRVGPNCQYYSDQNCVDDSLAVGIVDAWAKDYICPPQDCRLRFHICGYARVEAVEDRRAVSLGACTVTDLFSQTVRLSPFPGDCLLSGYSDCPNHTHIPFPWADRLIEKLGREEQFYVSDVKILTLTYCILLQ